MAPPGRMEQSAPQWSKQDDNCKGYENTWGTVLSSEPHLFCALIGHGCVASGPHVMSDHWLATTWCFCLLCFASFECTGFDSIDISFMEPRKMMQRQKTNKGEEGAQELVELSWDIMNTDDVRGHNSPQLCLHSSSRYFWYGGVPMSLLSWRFLAFFI